MAELSPAAYATLIILRAAGREISNTELRESHGVTLIRGDYEVLNGEDLVASDTKRRPYRHAITDKGVKVLGNPLTIELLPERRSVKESQLIWAAVVVLHNERVSRTDVVADPGDLDFRIRAAYTKLAGSPGDYVSLTDLRPLIIGVSKADLDSALVRLHDAPDVRLEPEPFGHRIGAAERDAAIHIGGEDRHKLAIGLR